MVYTKGRIIHYIEDNKLIKSSSCHANRWNYNTFYLKFTGNNSKLGAIKLQQNSY